MTDSTAALHAPAPHPLDNSSSKITNIILAVVILPGAGFAMVFALLIAAIIWNLGAWWLGLPSSSSHTLIGSVIGVGLMNQLMGGVNGTSGVDWGQATKIGYSLLASPVFGFVLAGG